MEFSLWQDAFSPYGAGGEFLPETCSFGRPKDLHFTSFFGINLPPELVHPGKKKLNYQINQKNSACISLIRKSEKFR